MSTKFKNWLRAATIRAVRTMAQTALSLIPVAVNITEVNWLVVLGVSITSGIISVLTSIVTGLPEAN